MWLTEMDQKMACAAHWMGLGYLLFYQAYDTTMVLKNAIIHGSALARWVDSHKCCYCGVGVLSAYPGLILRLAMSINVGRVQPLLLKVFGFSRLLALGESSLTTCASSMFAPLAHAFGGFLQAACCAT